MSKAKNSNRGNRDTKPENIPLGPEFTAALEAWAEDNIDASKELGPGEAEEAWRVVFEKKCKILSADERAPIHRSMKAALVSIHSNLAAMLEGKSRKARKTAPAADAPTAPQPAPRALEKIAGRTVHPAASMFPMMVDTELQELAQDIKDHGQRVAAVEYKGQILDGRNRLAACEIAGVEPVIEPWDERGGSPAAFVVSVNLMRRHLNESQRGMLAADLLPLFEAEAKQRQLAGLKKGGAAQEAPVSAPGRTREKQPAAAKAGAAANVGARTVERAKAVIAKSPKMAEQVRAGEVTLKEAERQLKHTEQVTKIRHYVPPEGTYSVIVVDFPWPFHTRNEDDSHRGRLTYPPMSIDDIIALDVGSLAADDCVMFMWATNTHLIDHSVDTVIQSLRPYGFTPKTNHTWIKTTEEAETPAELAETSGQYGTGNWGRGGTEHCIVLVKGQPVVDFKKQLNWFAAPRREHSRKPELFYQRVEEACPAPAKLELFARERRSGWVCSGAEVDEFEDSKAMAAIAAAPRDRDAAIIARELVDTEEDNEPAFEKNRKEALAKSYEIGRGIVAHRDWGAGFGHLVDTLDKGDTIELRATRGGAFGKGNAFTGPATVVGWGKDTRKQKLAVSIDGQLRTVDRDSIEAIKSVVSTRPIEALTPGVKNLILAWARDFLADMKLPKATEEHPQTQACWQSLIKTDAPLHANHRPAVEVQLHAEHRRARAEFEAERQRKAG